MVNRPTLPHNLQLVPRVSYPRGTENAGTMTSSHVEEAIARKKVVRATTSLLLSTLATCNVVKQVIHGMTNASRAAPTSTSHGQPLTAKLKFRSPLTLWTAQSFILRMAWVHWTTTNTHERQLPWPLLLCSTYVCVCAEVCVDIISKLQSARASRSI